MTPCFEEAIHAQRTGWFIQLRWAAVIGGMAILWTGPLIVSLNVLHIPYGRLTFLLLVLAFLNALYRRHWDRLKAAVLPQAGSIRKVRRFLHIQMAADLSILTLLLCSSGGSRNPLVLFYLFHLAISTILFSRKESLVYALCSIAAPWFLYILDPLLPPFDIWNGLGGPAPGHLKTFLLAYSLIVMGLWFFLTTLAVDLRVKEEGLKVAGERLFDANEELKQLDIFKNRFLKQVVFQLKKPAMEVGLNLGKLKKSIGSGKGATLKEVEAAEEKVWSLLQLTEDLIWLSRARVRDMPFKKSWVAVYETLMKAVQAKEAEAGTRSIHFQLHGDPQVRLQADQEAFEKVSDNLIANAVQYTPEGRGDILVEFKVEGDWLKFAVEDQGIGIPPKAQKNLFQEFYRGANAKARRRSGTGLGLSIVKYILDLHGGKIAITSESQKGTRVETWWPHSIQGGAPDRAEEEGRKPEELPKGPAQKTV